MKMNCFQHGEYEGKRCPECKPKHNRDAREQVFHETAESIRRVLLAHGIDTEAATDPVAVGFNLGEILNAHAYKLHQLGACLMTDWVKRLDGGVDEEPVSDADLWRWIDDAGAALSSEWVMDESGGHWVWSIEYGTPPNVATAMTAREAVAWGMKRRPMEPGSQS